MNAHLHLALGQDRLQALHAEARRARQARAARSQGARPSRLAGVLALLHLRARPA
ncbi:hypothetical protein DAETH_15730 [Deinococcus aetherius]|uniref:Uncharacterized protein n=1 Tax=Deinococcus aetherius TaxID=200252 RepID=A0ABM8ACU9_9DEIO|nr:hypothetical protein [Deinococcus aetherius]BDP41604.1 hypothetical protein DAETH_15730 [Deinococcus aetherius]